MIQEMRLAQDKEDINQCYDFYSLDQECTENINIGKGYNASHFNEKYRGIYLTNSSA